MGSDHEDSCDEHHTITFHVAARTAVADVRAGWDAAVEEVVHMLKSDPTLPHGVYNAAASQTEEQRWCSVPALPAVHCAFFGCAWEGVCEDELASHLHDCHHTSFLKVLGSAKEQVWWRPTSTMSDTMTAYRAAVTVKSQQQAPVAGPEIDRRALAQWSEAMTDDKVCALVCFVCAQKYPYVADDAVPEITYRPAFNTAGGQAISFLGLSAEQTRCILGREQYLRHYQCRFDCEEAEGQYWRELCQWSCDVPVSASVFGLCFRMGISAVVDGWETVSGWSVVAQVAMVGDRGQDCRLRVLCCPEAESFVSF